MIASKLRRLNDSGAASLINHPKSFDVVGVAAAHIGGVLRRTNVSDL
jgi:hypothetical protein